MDHNNNNNTMMIPNVVTDFIFDLYDSVTLSQIHIEQYKLYTTTFPELCHAYFPPVSTASGTGGGGGGGSTTSGGGTNQHQHQHQQQQQQHSVIGWPSPASIANECNGDPLFLAIYGELTHRYHFNHINTRPTLTDRIEGWYVYKELFDEILDVAMSTTNQSQTPTKEPFYLLPIWTFEILFEFIYQFQGYCQIKSAVYATAKKNHLLLPPPPSSSSSVAAVVVDASGSNPVVTATSTTTTTTTTTSDGTTTNNPTVTTDTTTATPTTNSTTKHVNLMENLHILEQNPDAWDVSIVFQYLHRMMMHAGLVSLLLQPPPPSPPTNNNNNRTTSASTTMGNPIPSPAAATTTNTASVNVYFGIFSCICLSRLECLLGDYYGCLLAVDPLSVNASSITVTKDQKLYTIPDIVDSVIGARVSCAYHVGIAYLQLRRYYDAYHVLMDCATVLQRGFKTNTIRTDLFQKQYDRIISLLIIIVQFCPGVTKNNNNNEYDAGMIRIVREKHNLSKIETVAAGTNGSNNYSNNNNNVYEEWFASPKFITSNPMMVGGSSLFHKQQIDMFHTLNVQFVIQSGNVLRSFLKLYTSIDITKLATFHDDSTSTTTAVTSSSSSSNKTNSSTSNNIEPTVSAVESGNEFMIPILLTYKARISHQLQRERNCTVMKYSTGTYPETAATTMTDGTNTSSSSSSSIQDDIHYYITNDTVYINEAEEQRHLESYLCQQMQQLHTIRQKIHSTSTKI